MGKLRGMQGVSFSKTNRLVVEPLDNNPVHAQVDGEALGRLPVEFKIVPAALKVLVPEGSLAAQQKEKAATVSA